MKILLLVINILVFVSCSNLTKRGSVQDSKKESTGIVNSGNQNTSSDASFGTGTVTNENAEYELEPKETEEPAPLLDASLQTKPSSDFVLVLGPGLSKSFAYIGVIKELEKRKIPIRAVVGVEWGSLIGAIYAKSGSVNNLEWQLAKWKDSYLPSENSWLKLSGPESINTLDEYLNTSFGSTNIESFKTNFKCISYSLDSKKAAWVQKAKASEHLKKCLASFPFYKAHHSWVANPHSYYEILFDLTKYKSNQVIVLDAMAKTNFSLDPSLKNKDESLYNWQRAQQHMANLAKHTKYYLPIDTSAYPLLNSTDKKELVRVGERAAPVLIQKLTQDFNF